MTNSSTSSSKLSVKSWRYRTRDILATLTAIGLIEVALHASVSGFNLFEQDEGITQRSTFVESAVRRAEKADTVDVVIVGSSIADGIDAEMLSTQIGNNASVESFRLVGADSKGTAQMLDTVVFPNLKVGWVVYVMSPHDTNGLSVVGERNVQIPSLEAYADNRFTYKLFRTIEKNFYLYRYRNNIKTFIPTIATLKTVLRSRNGEEEPKPYEFASYDEFQEAERFQEDLTYIYQLCQQHGTQLIILTLPTNPAADITSETFKAGAEEWLQSVEGFTQERNLGFVNGFDFIQEESQFRDTHHLSREGIVPTTKALGEVISSQ
ncbi:MAG: hypothetical protein AAFQ74_04220 [Cyanobacteria bacterium J06623_4]